MPRHGAARARAAAFNGVGVVVPVLCTAGCFVRYRGRLHTHTPVRVCVCDGDDDGFGLWLVAGGDDDKAKANPQGKSNRPYTCVLLASESEKTKKNIGTKGLHLEGGLSGVCREAS